MRIAIFCLLGPPLGMLCFFFMPGLADVSSRSATYLVSRNLFEILPILILMSVLSYVPGFAPAILTCQVDDYLSDKLRLNPRLVVTSLAGALIAVVWLSLVVRVPKGPALAYLQLALVGAIPAAMCSWLSDRWARGGTALSEPRQS